MTGRFRVLLIKPSHYDRRGYVIQWRMGLLPSNSLAALHGLILDADRNHALGPDVKIEVESIDEFNTVLKLDALMAWLQEAEAGCFVGLVGVQSNQFPRALDIARPFRAKDVPVIIGGFHVSGCRAMLGEDLPEDIREAMTMGCVIYCGEADGRMGDLLRAMADGTAPALLDHLADQPDLTDAPIPFLPSEVVRRNFGGSASFDAGRGCPFQCSFCTIINVQGRKSRYRCADNVEKILRENVQQGVCDIVVTDDNFARNRNWESILDRCIALREEEGLSFTLSIQVDTLCHKTPGFIEKAARAGVTHVFIGLENINATNLMRAKKRQNHVGEYRAMMMEWKRRGVITLAGYILGFPDDTPESIAEDLRTIQRELPIDILEFFLLTPLPGSEDHRTMLRAGAVLDPDMNKYDLEHVVTPHATMSVETLTKVYSDAWRAYYSPEHMTTVLRRAHAHGLDTQCLALELALYSGAPFIEGVHGLQAGISRITKRTQRRSGLPIENPLLFYPRRTVENIVRKARWAYHVLSIQRLRKRVLAEDPASRAADPALSLEEADLTPVAAISTA
ncbi:MAG: B12-binding domain-containing radical SAM protein [Rhodospirillaceae bacterium]